ncbi:unnamed protein product [Ilex paraguariensis]|uniref:ER membrane protein complex subunit 6 n=1 Tax=Ilex paraguariensis TaxID=185542 RepID=A0ABC8V335_9AQUA
MSCLGCNQTRLNQTILIRYDHQRYEGRRKCKTHQIDLVSPANFKFVVELLQVQVMAGHDDSGTSDKKSSQAINDLPTFNAENMQNNMRVIYYSRTFMSIVGGFIAGIFGFTGLMGFIFYFLVMAITSVGLTAKAGFSIHSFFDSWNRILLDGFLGGLMSFVLFWSFSYDIVHIF